jgi:hypothetical protein
MQWNKTYGSPTTEEGGNFVIPTSDGGYAVMSYALRALPSADQNSWMFKIDANGNMQWNQTYLTPGNMTGRSIVQVSDGGCVLAGYANATGNGNDFWLAKTDSVGNMLWNQTYGGSGDDSATGLVQASDGGYVIVGFTYSFGAGGQDAWLVKTNASGNMLWNKTYGGAGNENFQRVVRTLDGGYAISGATNSFGAGGNDMWFVKTDSYGNVQWSKTFGGLANDGGAMLRQTSDSGYIIIGNTASFGAGGQDFYLVKVGIEGESGLALTASTNNTVTLYRGSNDVYWNFVQVRIWKTH